MTNTIDIGNKIAQARKSLGLSQAQFAEALSISAQAVSKWERGASLPDIIMLEKIASAAGKDLSYFQNAPETESEQHAADETESRIRPYNMSMHEWKSADFSGLKNIGGKFSFSNIEKCRFADADMRDTVLKGNSIDSNDFTGADFQNAQFLRANLERNNFTRSSFRLVLLSSSNIDNNDFTGADFTDAAFKGCNIDDTNRFDGAVFFNTLFKRTNLCKVRFSGEMRNTSFESCDMKKIVFKDVVFKECFFKGQPLKKAVFENCKADKLSYAFLQNAKADMTGITLIED